MAVRQSGNVDVPCALQLYEQGSELTTNGSERLPLSMFNKPWHDSERWTRDVSPGPVITDAACRTVVPTPETKRENRQ